MLTVNQEFNWSIQSWKLPWSGTKLFFFILMFFRSAERLFVHRSVQFPCVGDGVSPTRSDGQTAAGVLCGDASQRGAVPPTNGRDTRRVDGGRCVCDRHSLHNSLRKYAGGVKIREILRRVTRNCPYYSTVVFIKYCTVLSRGVRSLFGPTRKSSPWGNFSDGGLNQSIKRKLSL